MIPSGLGVALPWQVEYLLSPTRVKLKLRCQWYYNYLANHRNDPFYVPMLWRPTPGSQEWADAILDVRATGRMHLLFNEPERTDQANMTPEEAAAVSVQYRNQARFEGRPAPWCGPNILVSPGSLQWLSRYKQAGGVKPPYWGIHLYANGPQHWDDLLAMFWQWCHANSWTRPVFVTENGAGDLGLDVQRAVMAHAVLRMKNTQWLHGICHFSALYGPENPYWSNADLFGWGRVSSSAGESVTLTGKLTPLGETFVHLAGGYSTFFPSVQH